MADYVGSINRAEAILDAHVEHGRESALRMMSIVEKSVASLRKVKSFFDIAPSAISTSEVYAILPAEKRQVVSD